MRVIVFFLKEFWSILVMVEFLKGILLFFFGFLRVFNIFIKFWSLVIVCGSDVFIIFFIVRFVR